LLRAALAPAVVLLVLFAPRPWAFAVCLVSAFLSDVFDGIVARRLGVATPGLRRLDSLADTFFYGAATFAAWRLHPAAIADRWRLLALLVALEVGRYAFDFIKFRREASYHMWSSKAWGIALFAAFFSLLVLGSDNVLVDVAVYLGIASDIEGLGISLALRRWQSDVPTILHASRLRAAP
jgi:phosphatidylglycerophosphate synthase